MLILYYIVKKEDAEVTLLLFYVDDINIIGNNEVSIRKLKYFTLKNLYERARYIYFLWIEIAR